MSRSDRGRESLKKNLPLPPPSRGGAGIFGLIIHIFSRKILGNYSNGGMRLSLVERNGFNLLGCKTGIFSYQFRRQAVGFHFAG